MNDVYFNLTEPAATEGTFDDERRIQNIPQQMNMFYA